MFTEKSIAENWLMTILEKQRSTFQTKTFEMSAQLTELIAALNVTIDADIPLIELKAAPMTFNVSFTEFYQMLLA